MRFEWDEAKRRANLSRHGIDFLAARVVFAGRTITFLDDRFNYGEARFLTLGLLWGRAVAIVHTETDGVIRIISIRKASKNEENIYFEEISDW
jgi:uncharacterized DUF497 family protein